MQYLFLKCRRKCNNALKASLSQKRMVVRGYVEAFEAILKDLGVWGTPLYERFGLLVDHSDVIAYQCIPVLKQAKSECGLAGPRFAHDEDLSMRQRNRRPMQNKALITETLQYGDQVRCYVGKRKTRGSSSDRGYLDSLRRRGQAKSACTSIGD